MEWYEIKVLNTVLLLVWNRILVGYPIGWDVLGSAYEMVYSWDFPSY